MNGDPEVRDQAQKSRAGCAILALIFTAVLYALSPPVVALLHDVLPPAAQSALFQAARVIYFPLNWLYFRVEFVRNFYDWYQGLFGMA